MRACPEVKAFYLFFKEALNIRLDLNGLSSEVEALYSTRLVRTLTTSEVHNQRKFVETNLIEQRTRSRLVEILISCNKIYHDMELQLTTLHDLLHLRFQVKIYKVCKTKEDRTRLIDNGVLGMFWKHLGKIDNLRDQINTMLKDIDQASYVLQRLVAILTLSADRTNREKRL